MHGAMTAEKEGGGGRGGEPAAAAAAGISKRASLPAHQREKWIEFGMEAQRRHAQPFVWICNTNRGVAKVSRAALRRVGNGVDDLECEGYLGDPSVKGSLRILRR